jgi:hypothetical protein
VTPEEASKKAYLLQAFRQIVANPAWVEEIAPKIAAAERDHNDGCTARNKTPAQRSEHVEAVHLARDLKGFCEKRIADLTADMHAHSASSRELE